MGIRGADGQGEFKPDVVGWGQRGVLSVATILEQINSPIPSSDSGAAELGKSKEEVEAHCVPGDGQEDGAKEGGQTRGIASRIMTEAEAEAEAGVKPGRNPDEPAATDAKGPPSGAPVRSAAELTLEDYEAALDADDALLGAIDV